ncbi:two-component sensor histidine kinase [Microlunatus endophyticus]|uniref:histidine kinase n=1 Tax=Microlunatus endophyticus TaxID=1716077 RepID=A0A917SAY0_9ACTN|nr:sensor histidine kinase [Microlunatus endophyticus]GGL68659.1 two-component sensor histidine kinase [Microlunatus endophyticus]
MSSAPSSVAPAQHGPTAWLSSWFVDPRYRFDLLSAIGIMALFMVTAVGWGNAVWVTGLMGLPWILRRRYPLAALIGATFVALLHLAVLDQPSFAIVAVPMYVYTFARWSDRPLRRAALLVAVVGSFLGPTRWLLVGGSPGGNAIPVAVITMLACTGMVGVAYVIGSRRREQVERAAQSVAARIERARLVAAEQEQRARVAAVDERTRIARELHDIVAHSLSVIVVQAEGGRALAAKQPEKAPEVLGTIADTSREALEEMRQMVGLLRSGGPIGEPGSVPAGAPESYLPTPGLADLDELVGKTGDRVTLTRYGTEPVVSQPLALTVYRIVQESITNVLKHAGPAARAAVGITYAEHGIGIRVVDNGLGVTDKTPGHGLRGMRERVGLHDGSLEAGPLPTGGFQVLAWLPYPVSPSPVSPYPVSPYPEASNPYQSRRS